MKERKPHCGGSGDSTSRSYYINKENASLKALNQDLFNRRLMAKIDRLVDMAIGILEKQGTSDNG